MTISYGGDYDYANAKLADSIVMLNNMPVYIHGVNNDGQVDYIPLGWNESYHTDLRNFDLTTKKLGYINLDGGSASYIARYPSRTWKQGLRMSNIYFVLRGLSRPIPMHSPNFINCILGKYPKIDVCMDILDNSEANSVAFSRSFSISKKSKKGIHSLLFKDRGVGIFSQDDKGQHFDLQPEYSFLTEMLNETVNATRS